MIKNAKIIDEETTTNEFVTVGSKVTVKNLYNVNILTPNRLIFHPYSELILTH